MITITGVEIIPLVAKFKRPLSFSGITRVSSKNIIIKIRTSEGIYGVGEACPVPGMSGETEVSICSAIKDYFTPILIGKDPLNIVGLTSQIEKCINGNVVAKAGINIALYDLAGKILNVPVYTLLGGRYRDQIEINGSVGIGTKEEMCIAAEQQMEEAGARYLKIYCGRGSVDDDVKKLKEVIRFIGDRARVFLDVNQQWSVKTAISAIRQLEDENLLYVEQPTPKWDLEGMKHLSRSVNTPIAADEAVFSMQDVALLTAQKAVDILTIYVLKPGGILRGHQAITMSEASGLDCFIGSYLELGIGVAAGAHLAASIEKLKYPCYLVSPLKYEYDILKEPLDIRDGMIKVPTGPGLGVELDEERLRFMRAE